jgi:hypothetical protein
MALGQVSWVAGWWRVGGGLVRPDKGDYSFDEKGIMVSNKLSFDLLLLLRK